MYYRSGQQLSKLSQKTLNDHNEMQDNPNERQKEQTARQH